MKCDHKWIYENKILLSNPPQRNRICSNCGKEERIVCGIPEPYEDTYERIKNKFSQKSK